MQGLGHTALLLEVSGDRTALALAVVDEVQVHFEAEEGGVWAIASGGRPSRLRGAAIHTFCIADGLRVPVVNREEEAALHLPLLRAAVQLNTQGPQSART